MAHRSARWFRTVMVTGAVVAATMVPAMEAIQHTAFQLWVHIPVTGLVLGLMSGGAGTAGVAFAEYQGRSIAHRQES